jgi:DNA primase
MDQVEEIKQKIDIVDLIGSYIKLKKAGANYKASCPFHQEKDPSFIVNPNRQIYKCFGCQRSGDIYSFIQEMEGVDFPGALKILADRAGVRLKRIDKKHYDNTKKYYEINELAAKFFEYILKKEKLGEKALTYLKDERLLEDKIIDKFRIGYALNAWDNLTKFLRKKGFSQEDIIKAGLAIKGKKNNSIYDRFRGRIMIPILNPADKVVGFTSRILPDLDDGKMGKYINSPETPIFNKSRTLFGKNYANKKIRETGRAIVVEGQFDVISSHQSGFTNTIATSGTALTKDQIGLIARVAEEIIFAFDSDSAGRQATDKGVELALATDLEVKVALIPGKFGDVDDVLRADPKLWEKALKNSREVLSYYYSRLVPDKAKDLSANRKKKIVKQFVGQVKKAKDPIIEGDWLERLSEDLEIDDQFINQAMDKYRQDEKEYRNDSQEKAKQTKPADKQKRIIGLVMTFKDLFDSIKKELKPELIGDKQLREIYQKFLKGEKLTDSQRKLADSLVLEVENDYPEQDSQIVQEEYKQLLDRIKAEANDKLKEEYAQKINQAEKKGDIKQVKKLIKKFQDIIN